VQTDAKVSPVNYGGPLVDLEGKVIGILSPIAAAEMLAEDGSMLYDSGIGFAIPLSDIQQRLPKLQLGNDIRTGKLGVVLQTQNEMAGPVRLTGAAPGTPAARAGAKADDIVIEAQGDQVELLADFREALAKVDAGEKFSFTVLRGIQRIPLSCELVAQVPTYRRRYLGLNVEQVAGGLRVLSVDDSSPAAKAGIQAGQTITHAKGMPLTSPTMLLSQVAVAELEDKLTLTIQNADQSQQTTELQPVTWPQSLIQHSPPKEIYLDAEGKEDPNAKAGVVQLKLADIPNVIHAVLPPQIEGKTLGCLILFPEPGAVDAEKLKTNWEPLVKDQGWIVVVPTSADAKNWTRDEALELPERLMARLAQDYKLDKARTVVSGIGVGGQMAIRAAFGSNRPFSAVLTINSTLRPFAPPKPNMPLESVDFLFLGPKLEAVAEQLNKLGFVANTLNPPGLDPAAWNSIPMEQIIQWLESLGRI
jgi:serine protease Do